jgi:hypothetical protein
MTRRRAEDVPPFDPQLALLTLLEHGVRFVVIGGVAGALWGSPSVTYDLDVCYAREVANLERLAGALRALHARLRGAPRRVRFLLDAKTLQAGDHFTFVTDAGNLDCLGAPSGSAGFDKLALTAVPMELAGRRVLVTSIDDLVRMKRAVGRPKDLIEIEILTALQDELDRRPPS